MSQTTMLNIAIIIVSTIVLTWFAVIAWQLDHDTKHRP